LTLTTAPAYRHELDGLRAVAVLAVLGYHAGYNDFSGGFMGVDVFLTLSGYLITQQIGTALSERRFHVGRFWLRRVRRLLPAMLPVLGLALASALILKGQGAFEAFARHFLSAGLFYSNYQFLSEADYFARASDTNLFLHTWSLSLEWQFYLVTPVVLLATHRLGRAVMAGALLALGVASLILAEALIGAGRSDWAFYGVLPRYWEFAAGGLIALLPPVLPRLPAAGIMFRALGLGCVLWAIFGYEGQAFPGLGAGWAVAGTGLVLAAPRQARDPVRWLLERRALQWVGLRSYAIYLVHWPLFVTVTPTNMNDSEGPLSVALLVSLGLGHMIYRYVETPVRTGARFLAPAAILRHGGGALAIIALIGIALPTGAITALREALPLSGLRATMDEIDTARAGYLDLMTQFNANELAHVHLCSLDTIRGPQASVACLTDPSVPLEAVLLIGDSHGRDAVIALSRAFPAQDFVMLHQSSCVPATYVRGRSLCFDGLEEVLAELAAQDRRPRVILAARWWQGEHLNTQATLDTLAALGASVLMIGPGPTFNAQIESLALQAALSGPTPDALPPQGAQHFAFDVAAVNADLRRMAREAAVGYVDRFALLCDPDGACPVSDGAPLYWDDQHLSPRGLGIFADRLAEEPTTAAFLAR